MTARVTAAEVEALAATVRKGVATLAEFPELPAELDAIAATLRGYELTCDCCDCGGGRVSHNKCAYCGSRKCEGKYESKHEWTLRSMSGDK